MAKIEITKTELVWPGKYNEDGTLKEVPRVSLPFQVIETVNESRATREAEKGGVQQTLFDIWEGKEGDTFEAGWRNKLIWGDNLLVMGSLPEKFAGKIDLIYIDPPFATGADFSFTAEIGEKGHEIVKDQSVIEEKAYRDTWGAGVTSYLGMMSARLKLIHDLLADNGSLFLHCDWHVGALLRQLLDESFGSDAFLNEIVWHYRKWSTKSRNFQRNHDTIFWYAKNPDSPKRVFNIVEFQDQSEGTLRRWKSCTSLESPRSDCATPSKCSCRVSEIRSASASRKSSGSRSCLGMCMTRMSGSRNCGRIATSPGCRRIASARWSA